MNMTPVESLIFKALLENEEFARKTLPFIKPEYFNEPMAAKLFNIIGKYVSKYNALPSSEAVVITLSSDKNITEEEFKDANGFLDSLKELSTQQTEQWLLDETDKFCQDRAIYNAIMASIGIIQGKDKQQTKEAIPDLLKDALAVSFDPKVGHDFLEDAELRYEEYHKTVQKIPWGLSMLNKTTKGGRPRKTLCCVIGGTGVGKSLFLCDDAAQCLLSGRNVLYITLELSEFVVSKRIEANLLDITMDDLEALPRDIYLKRIERVRNKTTGRLIVKEYPTASAHVGHFRHLLNELRLKKNFVPDLVIVDYINIMASARVKLSNSVNSYNLVKCVAEELRGLAVEFDVCVMTATQTNREGSTDSDLEMTGTADSFGLPMTLDWMGALISNDDLERAGQYMFKQLKNRFNEIQSNKRFVIGVNRGKMKLFDVEQRAQDAVTKDAVDGERIRKTGADLHPSEDAAWKARQREIDSYGQPQTSVGQPKRLRAAITTGGGTGLKFTPPTDDD